ncbi:MAG: CCA tRNA nucleotidyltransferase [Acidilobaceae archaeon]
MNLANEVEKEVIEYLRPTPWQLKALSGLAEIVSFSLRKCTEARGLKTKISIEGSFAKGTLLSDKKEIDVFVLFNNVTDEWIERESLGLLETCLKGFKIKKKHAQHPYVTVEFNDLSADVVPARLVESPLQSKLGVSRTPFHTEYIKSKLGQDPSLADEVRLLKSFMKGIGVYGAETGIDGFSGYLAELLVVYYGGFRNALRAATEWTPPVYIDIEGFGVKEEIVKRYRGCPIIIVDPVDPMRNAAAAVSLEKLALFILASKLYLRGPDKKFFHIFAERVKIEAPAVVVFCEGDFSNKDEAVVLGKLKRASDLILSNLKEKGFVPLWRTYGYENERAVIAIGLESLTMPFFEVRTGPMAWENEERLISFLSKRFEEKAQVWLGRDGRLYGLRTRALKSVSPLVALLKPKVSELLSAECSLEACEDSWRCLRDSGVSLRALINYPTHAWMRSA